MYIFVCVKFVYIPCYICHAFISVQKFCGSLVVPQTCRQIGDRAFSVAAPRAWNRLPTELKLLRSIELFCRDLKTFLFRSVMGTKIRNDSVMRPRSSSRGCNTSASVTVTVTIVHLTWSDMTCVTGICCSFVNLSVGTFSMMHFFRLC